MDLQGQHGLMATYRSPLRRRTVLTAVLAVLFTAFYVVLYYTEWFTPLAVAVGLGSKWWFYGALYSIIMIVGAVRMLRVHGNSRYHVVRLAVNVVMQVGIAFSLPFVMERLGARAYYFSYLWPLKMEYFYPSEILAHPVGILIYSVGASLLLVPILTIAFGKRWYCSWVCGCGALANTFGDDWRHLSSKSTRSWRFEQVAIHTSLVVALATTAIVVVNWAIGAEHPRFSSFAFDVQGYYGLIVGFGLSAAVGVGLYPVMGTRVWCRNFCPMAAYLGLVQKLGRFRIRVKKDMCISCGNCTTYCEMGIDVRSYAQSNQTFTRASCVGCGMCAHVCPRGVLRLENTWRRGDDVRRPLPVLDA